MAKQSRIWNIKTLRRGLLLTLVVMAADFLGCLNAPENLLYDKRAKYCQHFAVPPTDRLVHIDIDDESLQEIGAWPWPRAYLASIIDEISLAKPKVIGLDMYFPERQEINAHKLPDGTFEAIDNDELLAASIKRAGNVLLPISLALGESFVRDDLSKAIEQELSVDLELDAPHVLASLQQRGSAPPELTQDFISRVRAAREHVMRERLESEMASEPASLDAMLAKLTPRAASTGVRSDASKLLNELYSQVVASRAAKRFGLALVPPFPLINAESENDLNILPLAQVAAFSGFVDLPPSSEGVVRSVPMLINYRGKVFPHMALTLACVALDVDPKTIRFTSDAIILSPKNGKEVVIPVRVERSKTVGQVGALLNVPYWGTGDWKTMYDFPKHQREVAHIPIGLIWTTVQLKESIQRNNRQIDLALKDAADLLGSLPAEKYLKKPAEPDDFDDRKTAAAAVLKDAVDQGYRDILKKPDSELSDDEKKMVTPLKALQNIVAVNRESLAKLASDHEELRKTLFDKTLIVDWTAKGKVDLYPTSLHALCPGGVIQGTIVNDILTDDLWRVAPRWLTPFLTLLVGILTTLLVATLPPWRALLCTLGVMLAYALINGEILFDYRNFLVGIAGPLAACALVWSGLTLTNFISKSAEELRIRKRFSSYVDPALVEYVVEHPELARLDGQRREMTVVFTDLAGFTTISEQLGESSVPLLNSYFGKMVPLIRENEGYVNKFLGDGLMFFYNALRENSNHAVDAVRTVLQMQQVLIPFNESLKLRNLPPVGMRAGMTSGNMIVGDAGSRSDDERHNASDYTVLGDKVNLAARLESANKFFGSRVLMNQRTRELIGDEFLVRPMGKLVVAGKSEDVMTYEALCRLADASPGQILLAELSAKLSVAFIAGEFGDCLKIADELEQRTGDTKFAATFRRLAERHLKGGVDEDFQGEIVLSEK